MKFLSIYPAEKKLKPFLWKTLVGPASIVDGIIETLTLGNCSPSLKLKVARILAKSR
jgi:hypothetical protein